MPLDNLPRKWPTETIQPRPVDPPPPLDDLLSAALRRPIGAPPLAEMLQPDQQVAIIVDDFTRGTPVSRILPPLLRQLHTAGLPRDRVRLVIAPGTHRLMTPAEITARLGADIAAQYSIIHRAAADRGAMTPLGRWQDIPVRVNRAVAEAGLRIGVGSITPHMDAGFSGGAKIILPGVCAAETVDAFHTASAFIEDNQLGNIDAPLRRTLEAFVARFVPLHFIINTIPTLDGQVYGVVAGHPVDAHRAGAALARRVFAAPARRRYPVVVADCRPYDTDLWQSIKGIWAADLLTADRGTLIAVTAAPEGNSSYPLLPGCIGQNPDHLLAELKAGRVADAKQAATGVMVGRLKRRVNLVLVSPGLSDADAAAMGIPRYPTVSAAVEDAVRRLPPNERPAAVAVLPNAGVVLPVA